MADSGTHLCMRGCTCHEQVPTIPAATGGHVHIMHQPQGINGEESSPTAVLHSRCLFSRQVMLMPQHKEASKQHDEKRQVYDDDNEESVTQCGQIWHAQSQSWTPHSRIDNRA
eukprot:1153532-Pelagomonas_calceolata.AAC.10